MLIETDELVLMQEFGLYEHKYKEALANIRDTQKT